MLWSVLYKRESQSQHLSFSWLSLDIFHCHSTWNFLVHCKLCNFMCDMGIFGGILMFTLISLVLLLWKWWDKEECRPHCNTAVWRLAHWWYTMLYGGGWLIVDIQCCMVEASPLLIYNITWWRLGFCWYKNKRDMSL